MWQGGRHHRGLRKSAGGRDGSEAGRFRHEGWRGSQGRALSTGDWEYWIDRGGTFTDVVARRPDGALVTKKLLSDNPEQYCDAAVAGIRALMAEHVEAPIRALKMGTTVATQALLERKGDPVDLAIQRGFGSAMRRNEESRQLR